MRVFLTGASGFIGSRILTELLAAGHQVTGLARSDSSAQAINAAGAEVQRGTLEAPDAFMAAVQHADAVIHTAFDFDFQRFTESCEKDRRVIHAIGQTLKNSARPFIITSGTGIGDDGNTALAREDQFKSDNINPRVATEIEANALLAEGVNIRIVRLPQVHDTTRQGLVTWYIQHAIEKGAVACIGNGDNCWAAAHVSDVARLYPLVLEHGESGKRYHAIAEEGVPFRQIAEVIARKLNLPLISLSPSEAEAHFGGLALFIAMNLRASSAWTRQQLGWHPTGPGLLDDLQNMDYASLLSSR
ncbi:SDR family oxidoreductase [Mixta intestinalis]|jgi:nucleoside-diphosphate-sugar epimerase|uniref:dTDP-4-oxo-6-deoxy-D-allose reductase n=1 Tax=Mixta intestinalis TaxID=1615494 RepID=A0A6P1PW86_9GAMM|nr:SDR family oxidoreductase [Mixta intestinalis]QHM70045.1 dTDP-4-oxo-6-deoxy-D-allose reductase [Mixta intestinalis]